MISQRGKSLAKLGVDSFISKNHAITAKDTEVDKDMVDDSIPLFIENNLVPSPETNICRGSMTKITLVRGHSFTIIVHWGYNE